MVTTTYQDLKKASEGWLLEYACLLYTLDHPAEHGHAAIAVMIGKSQAHVDQCVANNAHIGGDAWLKIESAIGRPIYHEWLQAKSNHTKDKP